MKHHTRILLAAALFAGLAPAAAQQFSTVGDHTVIGRIGAGNGSGPSQAIPFATLITQIGVSRTINTTAPLAGGGNLSVDRTFSINANGISNALLRQSAALSLVGNATNALANVADISATPGSSCVFMENASTLTCANIATANIAASAVTYAKIQNVAASSILGNPTGSPAAPSEISLGSTLAFVGSALRTTAITGDVSSSANSFATTLATVNANVGSFGSATNCVSFTTNGKGLITAASQTICTPAIASVTGLGTGVATALGVNVGAAGSFVVNGGALGSPSSAGTLPAHTLGGAVTGNGQNITGLNAVGAASVIFSPTTGGIVGTTTNDNTAALYVGEFVSSIISGASPISLTNATPANITSISLTAGDWDVWGNVGYIPAATTNTTTYITAIHTVSATLPGTANPDRQNFISYPNAGQVIASGNHIFSPTIQTRFSLGSTTTIYLIGRADFTVSTQTGYGYIMARRRR